MRRIRKDTPERAAARLERFLAHPSSRISEDVVARRRNRNLRKSQKGGLADRLSLEQGCKCWYCGIPLRRAGSDRSDRATVEHRQPISRGGTNSKRNTVAACAKCNTAKGSMTEEEFRLVLANTPTRD